MYPFAGQVEGTRGAVSFVDTKTVLSQTSWFVETQEQLNRPDVLIGASHYDIPGLRKQALSLVFSSKSQRIADLFINPDTEERFFKEGAFFLSAHTHAYASKPQKTTITFGDRDIVSIPELNVGSTTDYPSLSAIVRLSEKDGEPNSAPHLAYENVRLLNRLPARFCSETLLELEATDFTGFDGLADKGREAIYLQEDEPFAYRDLNNQREKADAVFSRIDSFISNSSEKAICLGLEAGRLEAQQKPEQIRDDND